MARSRRVHFGCLSMSVRVQAADIGGLDEVNESMDIADILWEVPERLCRSLDTVDATPCGQLPRSSPPPQNGATMPPQGAALWGARPSRRSPAASRAPRHPLPCGGWRGLRWEPTSWQAQQPKRRRPRLRSAPGLGERRERVGRRLRSRAEGGGGRSQLPSWASRAVGLPPNLAD